LKTCFQIQRGTATPWAKLRPNAWRNAVTRKKLLAANRTAAAGINYAYFPLEDFAWDLNSQHPGVRRVKSSGNYVVDCAHYCVNFGGLPHFTLLAALHEAARGVLGEDQTRGGVGPAAGGGSVGPVSSASSASSAAAAAASGTRVTAAAAAEEETETEVGGAGWSPVVKVVKVVKVEEE
jgi:hypothetical protein